MVRQGNLKSAYRKSYNIEYKRVAESVDIPVLIYNNPGRTNVNLEAETVKRLAEIDNIVGIKDSSGDLTLTAQYIMECPDDFAVPLEETR